MPITPPPDVNIEAGLRRLAARGYYEISPTQIVDRQFTEGHTTYTEYGPGIQITWAPKGQGGPRGPVRFNPWCKRGAARATLSEALAELLEATEPRRLGLDDLVGWRLGGVESVMRFMAGRSS